MHSFLKISDQEGEDEVGGSYLHGMNMVPVWDRKRGMSGGLGRMKAARGLCTCGQIV